jgi:hypothetical protein
MGDRDKDVEILALRHQITVLERQLEADVRVRSAPEDRAFLAALLTPPPRTVLRRLRLLVRPDTVLRRHRDLKADGFSAVRCRDVPSDDNLSMAVLFILPGCAAVCRTVPRHP